MEELTMYAVVDSQGKLVKTECEECKVRYWIFKSEEEARNELDDELSTINEEIDNIKSEAKVDENEPEDYEDWDYLLELKRQYENCKIVPVKVIQVYK